MLYLAHNGYLKPMLSEFKLLQLVHQSWVIDFVSPKIYESYTYSEVAGVLWHNYDCLTLINSLFMDWSVHNSYWSSFLHGQCLSAVCVRLRKLIYLWSATRPSSSSSSARQGRHFATICLEKGWKRGDGTCSLRCECGWWVEGDENISVTNPIILSLLL